MTRSILRVLGVAVLGATLSASGGKATGGGTTGTELTMRIPNETAPAGSMVQMKVMTTEVTPISGGRPAFAFDTAMFASVAGFGMFAPTGEIAGAAIVNGNRVQIVYDGTSSLTADYPVVTVVLPLRGDLAVGTKTQFTFDASSVWNFGTTGPVTARISPATVTAGGNTAITDVIPGEGVWPAGTVVSVRGVGFDAKTSLRVNDAGVKAFTVVSPTEMQFTLTQTTNMRGLKITASGSNSVDYYAYMRGITAAVSARPLLSLVEPIFSTAERTTATLPRVPAFAGNQYQGVALQNPTMDDVTVGLSLRASDGSELYATTRVLAARNRLALEASELLDGIVPPEGSSIVVTASQPIDVFSLLCDEGTGAVVPLLPLESHP